MSSTPRFCDKLFGRSTHARAESPSRRAAIRRRIAASFAFAIVLVCARAGDRGAANVAPAGLALSRLASDAVRTLLRSFYAGHGLWRDCPDARCSVHNGDWGSDSLTNTLFLRLRAAHDASVRPILAELAVTASQYGAPCDGAGCSLWSDVPMWDAVAAAHEYEAGANASLALDKAKSAFWAIEGSHVYDRGACPSVRYQRPFGRGDHLKTLETDANGIEAATLLFEATHDARYLDVARRRYDAARRYFLDSHEPLYSVYVFDDGRTCRQVPHRFFASVNGAMISNGLRLARLTGSRAYRDQAVATARAVAFDLADANGAFADLQAENDVVEPLVEAMFDVTTLGARGAFARAWLVRNATVAASDRRDDGTYGRFFDGPPPVSNVTAWQTNGGFAIEIAAGALAPALRARGDAWRGARFVAHPIDRVPATIRFDGDGFALAGTIGDVCCQPGHARVFIDGRETASGVGIWQNKSSSGRRLPNSILFAWRWKTPGRHRITFEPGPFNAKEGGSYLRAGGYYTCRNTPIVTSHFSTSSGHEVAGNVVRRKPKAWPP